MHARIYAAQVDQAGPEIPGRCNHFLKRGAPARWARCGREYRAPGEVLCTLHANLPERRAERNRQREQRMEAAREHVRQTVRQLMEHYTARHQAGETLQEIIEHVTNEAQVGNISWHIRHVVLFHIAELIPGVDIQTARDNVRALALRALLQHHRDQLEQQRVPRVRIAGPPNLAEFVNDRQNVHRRVVSEQTNAGTELLLRQIIPAHPRTCQVILGYWMLSLTEPVPAILRVFDDMYRWYSLETCRADGDRLYHRMLDGLWVLINAKMESNADLGVELVRRLYEECRDSVSTCCEGHITRLVNVMCGFDDAFHSPVSLSEILGEKFARIQQMEVPLSEKLGIAARTLDDLGVPVDDRVAWINALE